MAIRLEGARRAANRTLMDRCRLRRDPEGKARGELDPVTLERLPIPDVSAYWRGPCSLSPAGRLAQTGEVAGAEAAIKSFNFALPATTPELRVGDVVEMERSTYDPTLKGKQFVVQEIAESSFLVLRQATVTRLATSRG